MTAWPGSPAPTGRRHGSSFTSSIRSTQHIRLRPTIKVDSALSSLPPMVWAEGSRQVHECWAEAEGTGRWTVEALQQARFSQPPESLWATVNSALSKPVKATWEGDLLQVEFPEPGEVDVLVRGSDGKPLADRPVQVMPVWQLGETSHGPADARFTGKLDANGRFRLRWFASVRQLRVMVPGEGFGSTGPIEVKNGSTTKVEMSPLAKFGSIAGKLDTKLVGPGIFVHIDPEHHAPVACDASGRFAFGDVPPGRYVVRVTKGDSGPGVNAAQIILWLAPGQKIEGLIIDALSVLPPEIVARQKAQQARTLMQFNGKPGKVLWAEGTVKETSGRPLVKADVYLRTAHHGGIRMYEDILATTTDAQGHYSFSGEVHPTTESPVLVAKVEGRPPAVANAEARTVQNDRPAKVDLTVADVGGSASVTVLRDGKPLPNAKVQLEATGSAAILSGFGWARDSGGPEKSGVRGDGRAERGHRPRRRGPVRRAHPGSLHRPRDRQFAGGQPPSSASLRAGRRRHRRGGRRGDRGRTRDEGDRADRRCQRRPRPSTRSGSRSFAPTAVPSPTRTSASSSAKGARRTGTPA